MAHANGITEDRRKVFVGSFRGEVNEEAVRRVFRRLDVQDSDLESVKVELAHGVTIEQVRNAYVTFRTRAVAEHFMNTARSLSHKEVCPIPRELFAGDILSIQWKGCSDPDSKIRFRARRAMTEEELIRSFPDMVVQASSSVDSQHQQQHVSIHDPALSAASAKQPTPRPTKGSPNSSLSPPMGPRSHPQHAHAHAHRSASNNHNSHHHVNNSNINSNGNNASAPPSSAPSIPSSGSPSSLSALSASLAPAMSSAPMAPSPDAAFFIQQQQQQPRVRSSSNPHLYQHLAPVPALPQSPLDDLNNSIDSVPLPLSASDFSANSSLSFKAIDPHFGHGSQGSHSSHSSHRSLRATQSPPPITSSLFSPAFDLPGASVLSSLLQQPQPALPAPFSAMTSTSPPSIVLKPTAASLSALAASSSSSSSPSSGTAGATSPNSSSGSSPAVFFSPNYQCFMPPPPQQFLCPMCKDLVRNPVLHITCSQLYCTDCVIKSIQHQQQSPSSSNGLRHAPSSPPPSSATQCVACFIPIRAEDFSPCNPIVLGTLASLPSFCRFSMHHPTASVKGSCETRSRLLVGTIASHEAACPLRQSAPALMAAAASASVLTTRLHQHQQQQAAASSAASAVGGLSSSFSSSSLSSVASAASASAASISPSSYSSLSLSSLAALDNSRNRSSSFNGTAATKHSSGISKSGSIDALAAFSGAAGAAPYNSSAAITAAATAAISAIGSPNSSYASGSATPPAVDIASLYSLLNSPSQPHHHHHQHHHSSSPSNGYHYNSNSHMHSPSASLSPSKPPLGPSAHVHSNSMAGAAPCCSRGCACSQKIESLTAEVTSLRAAVAEMRFFMSKNSSSSRSVSIGSPVLSSDEYDSSSAASSASEAEAVAISAISSLVD